MKLIKAGKTKNKTSPCLSISDERLKRSMARSDRQENRSTRILGAQASAPGVTLVSPPVNSTDSDEENSLIIAEEDSSSKLYLSCTVIRST